MDQRQVCQEQSTFKKESQVGKRGLQDSGKIELVSSTDVRLVVAQGIKAHTRIEDVLIDSEGRELGQRMVGR
ncbi:hypothetical protein D0C37_14535 [Streptomyces koyangensis]|uniref:Uncharacterized protein n=1 Tax=Streptomyces koyangensis TaxID=188770 RepID=A0A385DBA6_9ACTN|nr:hypothetical protein D0C37_14535 [Streptomyces koyangensis]